ncbi:hypothetical protein EF72_21320 [Salmonella enterica]|nr:hypothetical protein [Salmonella enterica]
MFRANEEAQRRLDEAAGYFFPAKRPEDKNKMPFPEIIEQQNRIRHAVEVISNRLGPFVDSYPEWHPFISFRGDGRCSETRPNLEFLDHTRFMVNGFITCPYHGGDQMIETVNQHSYNSLYLDGRRNVNLSNWFRLLSIMGNAYASYITEDLIAELEDGEELDRLSQQQTLDDADGLINMYAPNAQPILVWFDWYDHLKTDDNKIPAAAAVPLMLARNLADLPNASCSETWEDMRHMLMGSPHGARSSMFLDQLTVKQMRTMFNALMATGAYDK